jgi:hypothetical protein
MKPAYLAAQLAAAETELACFKLMLTQIKETALAIMLGVRGPSRNSRKQR